MFFSFPIKGVVALLYKHQNLHKVSSKMASDIRRILVTFWTSSQLVPVMKKETSKYQDFPSFLLFSYGIKLTPYRRKSKVLSKNNRVNFHSIFHSIFHWRHSLGSDVSDHFFWSANVEWTGRDSTRWVINFHSILELELCEIHSSTNEISSLHRWSELFTRLLFFFF